ncbi:MAG TPA: UDP-N-acetylmuramoyl-L-alanyl-D-glutamate--2,6-diaminopimelate ligase, partial [Acidimicrobiales bacterium]|nr:UDP-N-acetylmuramoyl-L-alanyl-D-glutamate--2,6-diaminopimelate ligase [Acidimicrobiales bacterium]
APPRRGGRRSAARPHPAVGVRLTHLAAAVEGVRARLAGGGGDPDVRAVEHDTRRVGAGALFCCVPGARVDGHDLASAAVSAGAVALLVDHELAVDVPQVVVEDVRAAMGPVAAAFWDHPSRHLSVVGVTGTSGKTTTTHLLAAVLTASRRPCGVVGTLSGARTTPEAPELQASLADHRRQGDVAVALEVSSHGLDQGRVAGTRFAVAVFTNLSQDHLDYHGTMAEYFAAKARLFTPAFTSHAVVCVDDDWGVQLAERVAATAGVALHPFSSSDAEGLRLTPAGATFAWRGHRVDLRLAGRFNVRNALGAATAAAVLGVDGADVARGLGAAPAVPGRFEAVDAGQPFTVLVDYAHKPGALDKALRAARELVGEGGRLVVAFGAGGDRDAAKRPVMGEVAARLADRAIVTSDNPRSERPAAIIGDILAGVPAGAPVTVEPDRRAAIGLAIQEARPGDVVLVAGKGHETTQAVGDLTVAFDDRVVARQALAATLAAAPGPARRPEGA